MKMVKVQIRDDYDGHYHAGKLCEPGDIIEVTPRQAAWLHKIGATKPVKTAKPKKKASTEEEVPPEAEVTTEGGEETPEDL